MKKVLFLCSLLLAAFAGQAQVNLLNESFNVTANSTTPPTGWSVSGTGSTNGCWSVSWEQVPSGGFVCTKTSPSPKPTAHTGTGMAGYNSWDIFIGGSSELVSPSLNFTALGTYTLSFWVYNQQTFYEHDSLRVFVNTSPTSVGGTMLYAGDPNYNSSPTGWAQYTYNIPATYTGATNYIIFRGVTRYGYDVFFDDVLVDRWPPTPCTGTPLTPTITTAAITTPLCLGTTPSINAVDPNLPATSGITYMWQSAPAATGPWTNVTTGTGSTTLNYTTGPLTGSFWYRIAAICSAGSANAYSAAYYIPTGAPQPGTITGPTTFCPGDAATYSVPNVSGTTYTWTLPSGWSGSSSTNSIVVTPGTTAGNISVFATTTCGPSVPQSRALVAGSAPATPGTIAGNNNICFGTTQIYSVAAVSGATSYTWTLPTGWIGTSTTNSITVTANSTPGNVSVLASNGCGQSPAANLAVSVITSLANPGIISGKDTVCSGSLQSYSIAAVPGATSYTWTLPTGWSGTTTGTSVQVFAGSAAGTIGVTAYVACATSPSASKTIAVTTTVNPAVSISAPATTLCQGTPITITATPTFPGTTPVYQWKKNGVNVAAFGPAYTSNTIMKGDTVTVTMTSNADCPANTTAVSNTLAPNITPAVMPGVSINTVPPVTLCKGVPTTFYTTSNGTGATPSYQWYKNGSQILGSTGVTYTDNSLVNGDTLTIEMTTSADCAIMPVATSNKVGVHVDDPATPTVSISASPSNLITPGQPVTFTATNSNGGATPDYQWQKNGVNIPFETTSIFTSNTLLPGDNITVKMLSYADCVVPGLVTSNIIVMKSALGVGGGQNAGGISIYPNPNSGRFTVAASAWDAAYSGKQVRVDVLSAVGQSVYHMELVPSATSWKTQVSLGSELANGRYMLRVSTEDGAVRTILPFMLSR